MRHKVDDKNNFKPGVFSLVAGIMLLTVLATVTWTIPGGKAAAQESELAKVVYHADFSDPRRFSAMLTSINNMITTYENELAEYE